METNLQNGMSVEPGGQENKVPVLTVLLTYWAPSGNLFSLWASVSLFVKLGYWC